MNDYDDEPDAREQFEMSALSSLMNAAADLASIGYTPELIQAAVQVGLKTATVTTPELTAAEPVGPAPW